MIDDIIEISKKAGEIIRQGFGSNFNIEYKTNESNLVTDIDKASEALIVETIKRKYPGHGILAEEGGARDENAEYRWVIDPLDGTTNFAHGLPIFSVSIGLQKNGETIAGAVYDVMRDIVYTAEKGKGAFANGRRINVSSNSNLMHSVLVTGFPYNIYENPDNALGKFTALTTASRGIRRLGSAAIDFCYVCAGMLIVEEAGGKVTDFEGNKIDIFSKRFLSTNSFIHPQMIEILAKN